jgi:anti-sigma regulatory factor (Ser/Thr protein kinase)
MTALDRQYPGGSATLRETRGDLATWLTASGIGGLASENAVLVLSELASNAVEAAPGHPYRVKAWLDDQGSVRIAVANSSPLDAPLLPRESTPSSVLAVRGRGLMIVTELCDEVDVDQSVPGEIVVTVLLRSTTNR